MEYNKTFALVEAVALIGLTAWLFYFNALSSRRDADDKDAEQGDTKDGRDEIDRP